MILNDILESLGAQYEKIFIELADRVLSDITRRIKAVGDISSSADFQLNQLYKLGYTNQQIKELVKDSLEASDEYIDEIFSNAIKEDYIYNKALYDALSVNFIPFENNAYMQNLIAFTKEKCKNDVKNMCNSMGFVLPNADGTKVMGVDNYFRDIMDKAFIDVSSGSFSYEQTLRKAVNEMTRSGIRYINYESGYHSRVEVAARRSLQSGLANVSVTNSNRVAKELGVDTFEVSAHSGARPSHASWQGKVYTSQELESICGLGTVTGLLGANCYHMYYPFVEGISKRNYSDDELYKMEHDEPKEYQGKHYTEYEARQQMRAMERDMRVEKERIKLLKDGDGSKEDIRNARARLNAKMDDYKNFADKMGLKEQRERVHISDTLYKEQLKLNSAFGDKHVKVTDEAIRRVQSIKLPNTNIAPELIQSLHKELLSISKDNYSNEVLALLNTETLEVSFNKGESNKVDISSNPYTLKIFNDAKRKFQKLICMHNHGFTNDFSYADLGVFRSECIQALTLVTNKGKVRAICKTDKYDADKMKMMIKKELESVKKKMFGNHSINEEAKALVRERAAKNFLKKCKEAGIIYIK